MSFKLAGKCWDVQIEGRFRLLLIALADFADDDGNGIYPAVATVAWKIDYSERQTQRLMRELEAMKVLIEVGASPRGTKQYRLDLSALPKKEKRGVSKCHPCQNVTPDKMSPPGVTNSTENDLEGGDKMSPKEQALGTERSSNPTAGAVGESAGEDTGEVSEHRRFIELWTAAYLEKFGTKYFFNGAKDGSAASRLLKSGEPAADIVELAKRAWSELGTGFLYQQSTTIAGFASKLNEINAVLAVPRTVNKPVWMQIRDLENEVKPLRTDLDELNTLLHHDCNRTPENLEKRKNLRERVQGIDEKLAALRLAQ